MTIIGWAFTQHGGTVFWDRAGLLTRLPQGGQSADSLAGWLKRIQASGGAGLPKPVAASIEHYVAYAQAGGFRQEAMITFLADRLATHAIEPARFGGDEGFRNTPVIADLNLYPDDVTGLLARREKVLELVAAMIA